MGVAAKVGVGAGVRGGREVRDGGFGWLVLEHLVQLLHALHVRQVVKGRVHAPGIVRLSCFPRRQLRLERRLEQVLQPGRPGAGGARVGLVDDELVRAVLASLEKTAGATLAGLEVGSDVEARAGGHGRVVALGSLQSQTLKLILLQAHLGVALRAGHAVFDAGDAEREEHLVASLVRAQLAVQLVEVGDVACRG